MKWFKHFTNWHEDRDIRESISVFGLQAYSFYCIIKEIYGLYYNDLDEEGFLKIQLMEVAKKCHISRKQVINILDFFQKKVRMQYKNEGDYIYIKVPEFIRLAGSWRIRAEGQNVTPHREESEPLKKEERKKKEEEGKKKEEERIKAEEKDRCFFNESMEILNYLNKKCRKGFTQNTLILNMLKDGKQKNDFIKIIDNKTNDPFFVKNPRLLNPVTLFKSEHFEIYLNETGEKITVRNTDIKEKYMNFLKSELSEVQAELFSLMSYFDIDDEVEDEDKEFFYSDYACIQIVDTGIYFFTITDDLYRYKSIIDKIELKTARKCYVTTYVPEDFIKKIEEMECEK